jgi:signal transduction histidine kinase
VLDISLTVSPLRNADGRIVGASKVARDITVRKHAEEQLRLSEQRAVAAVQARDDFLSTAAHELRNPLNALQLQLVGLHRAAQQSDEWLSRLWVTDRIGQAVEDTAALVRLVHNLLDVARIAAGRLDVEPEDIDFADVIRAVVRRFGQQLVGERVMIEAPAVRGRSDRLRFEQIVTNLVSNAIKFGGGKPIEITLRADDERAYLAVSDHGIGIDPERQSQLFERFSRAVQRREYGGFGLGLWIARETVSAMGGEIWFSSSPGEGTTFSVSLPRVLAKEATAYAVK